MKTLIALLFCVAVCLPAQTDDPWKGLSAVLEGTWDARTTGGAAGATSTGTYTFQYELSHHIMARHSKKAGECKGPEGFDCDHSDLLYIFQEAPGQALKAIYFDNEGHVIHYGVSMPDAKTVQFLSDGPGPQFRLLYTRKESVLAGKFQMKIPGQGDWKSYLEWSGSKQ